MSSPLTAITRPDLVSLAPELLLTGAGLLILMLDAFLPTLRRWATPLTAAALLGAAALLPATLAAGESFDGLIEGSAGTAALAGIVLTAALIATLASDGYLRRERIYSGEYHVLLLWCVVGLLLMSRAVELLTIFLTLELLSICLYSLAGFHRRLAIATEGAIKYFLLGAFVSAFVLLGIALIFGATGTTRLTALSAQLAGGWPAWPVGLGAALLIAAFGFKMSLVPFHAWSPDTYQGAPSPFVAFLSVAPKAAAAIVLLRLLEVVMTPAGDPHWSQLVAVLAVLSMVGGNLLALVQRDIKRMLAYSGIAHMGYLLIPLVTLDGESWRAVLVYLLAYALMNGGAFAVVALLYARAGEQHLISELSGWGQRFPLLAACLTICLLSLGGIPPTLGFLGKYMVFLHGIRNGHLALVLIGVLTSLLGVYYYLRVVYNLYMKPETKRPEGLAIDVWGRVAATLAALGTILLGIWPTPMLDWLVRTVGGP